LAALAVAVPALAQGKGNGHKSTAPSRTPVPGPSMSVPATSGTVPVAWIDDASVLPPGQVALATSIVQWQGTDLSEVDVPVVGIAVGVAERVQLGVLIPHVVGSSDPTGVPGGVGTSFVSAKIGLLRGAGSGVKLAVAPTVEILSASALQSLTPGEGR